MFERDTLVRQSGTGSLADVERRVALSRGDGRLSIQDQLDWGEALVSSGDESSGRVLLQSAFIRQGFSPELEASRRTLREKAGIAGQAAAPVEQRRPGNTVDLAVEELRAFARSFGASIAATLSRRPRRSEGVVGLHPTAVLRRAAFAPGEQPMAEVVGELFQWLCGAAPNSTIGDRALASIEALRGADGDPRRFSAAALAGAAPTVLASAIALQELRFFLRSSRDLLLEPLGSCELFRAVATFRSAGLGPYFGNLPQIVRRSADVSELAGIADQAAGDAGSTIGEEVWVVLLSRSLEGALWAEVVDDLGDRNAAFALQIILERALALPADDIDRALVMRIRDAALDNLDYELAGVAQRSLVELKPDDMLERRILGSIDASGGRVAAAHQNLSACLARNPEDRALREEIEANLARRYAPLALTKGFGSPEDRQLARLQRRTTHSAGSSQVGMADR